MHSTTTDDGNKTIHVCRCCALMAANNDSSECRDGYGHTHESSKVPFFLTGDEEVTAFVWTCESCGRTVDDSIYVHLATTE